jgi:hypothetical protein
VGESVTRLHKGKHWELFIWRDLCGRYRQTTTIKTPRWAKWYNAAWSGSIVAYMNANQPTSNECQRVDMDPAFYWDWQPAVPGVVNTNIEYRITFDTPGGNIRADMMVTWAGGHAEADKTWTTNQIPEAIPPFLVAMNWDHRSSTNNTLWNWGVGGVSSTLGMDPQGYPYP